MTSFILRRLSWRTISLIGFESLLIIGGVFCAAYVRLGDSAWRGVGSHAGVARAMVIALVCQVCLYFTDLYDLRIVADRRELVIRTLQALGITSLVLAAVYFWFPQLIIGRGVFLITAVLVATTVSGWRIAFSFLSRRAGPRERLLLVGAGQAAIELARELQERREELGTDIIGFVDVDPASAGQTTLNPRIIGAIEDIPRIVREASVDRVVVSLADARGKLPTDRLLEMKLKDGVRFDHLASVYEEYTGKIAIENLRPSWLIFSEGFRKKRWLTAAKRASDVALAVLALTLALPLMLLIAVAIKLTSPGPVFYRQQRVGQHGRVFTIEKFRSMRADAEAETGAVWSKPDDPRVTRVGRFLRRTRFDEIPQLRNVLIGEMSFVGPRPERPEFVEELTRQIPFYGQRHVVKPGLTGWAQVRYTYGASVVDAMEKLQLDLFYIKNMSPALDVYIMLETVRTVLVRSGS